MTNPGSNWRYVVTTRPSQSDRNGYGIIALGMRNIIKTVDNWLDSDVAETYKDQPLAQDWARVAKTAEEISETLQEAAQLNHLTEHDRARIDECTTHIGHTISALISCTGQNPRKGVCGTQDAMLKELADVVCTALFAIQHFTKDADDTARIVEASLLKALDRATGTTKK